MEDRQWAGIRLKPFHYHLMQGVLTCCPHAQTGLRFSSLLCSSDVSLALTNQHHLVRRRRRLG